MGVSRWRGVVVVSWQRSIESWIDDLITSVAESVQCTSEEAEDFAIDYLMAKRCGEVEGYRVGLGYHCFDCGEEASWAREEFLPKPYRRRAACHWAAARWLEDRQK